MSWFMEYVVPILGTAAATLAIPMLHRALAWLHAKANEAELGKWSKLADLAFEETDTAVSALQPLADELKERSKDGTLSQEDVKSLKGKAVDMVSTSLKPVAADLLKKIPATLIEGWVDHLVAMRQDPKLQSSVANAVDRLAAPAAVLTPTAPAAVPPIAAAPTVTVATP